jgi:hypothetical protein
MSTPSRSSSDPAGWLRPSCGALRLRRAKCARPPFSSRHDIRRK